MDFGLTKAQRELRDRVADFASTALDADPGESDRSARLDRKAWRRCAEFGLFGWPVPRRYGGQELDPLTIAVGLEALGYGCRDNGLVFAVNNHLWACVTYVLDHGTPEQCARFLPGLVDGTVIGAQAMTEEHAGSDVLAVRTTAVRDGGTYVLDGVKTFISNAPVAGLFVVFARTADQPAVDALTAFLVESDRPGLRVRRRWAKSGLRSAEMGEIEFTGCRVPTANMLGEPGDGYRIFTTTIDWERVLLFASQVGVLQRLLDDCVAHARERRQFGRPIGANQAVAHRLADLKAGLEVARLALRNAAWRKASGRVALLDAAIAKLVVSELHVTAATVAVGVHGARGYLTEFGVERELRDAVAGTIYGGTSDIQRDIIARLLGLPTVDGA